MTVTEIHTPVLLRETVGLLAPRPGHWVIDATLDGGGHASVILQSIGETGRILGIERDPDVVAVARKRLAEAIERGRLLLAHGSFRRIGSLARERGFDHADAILFDLGMSSFHLDQSGRGFSFQRDEPLDMRFDRDDPDLLPASHIVDTWSLEDLTALFREYGEERYSGRIARRIVASRPIPTTTRLLDLITQVLPGRERQRAGRSAARIFQALRIAVNDELDAIREALPQALDLLAPGGRIAVIAFHSLEDRIVKQQFAEGRRDGRLNVLTKRPIRPADAEILANPRAASARLRVAEKKA